MTRLIADELNRKWGVGVRHPLYSKTGNWYHNLRTFPGALFDPDGYVLFRTQEEYESCPYLRIKKDLWVPNKISAMPSYVRVGFSN